MSPPEPKYPLENHCSVIYNNTLYVYSPEAFQSLPLHSNAEWSEETMGVSLTGTTCNLGWVEGDSSRPALYVIGGSLNDSTTDYHGLQRYDFNEKNWTSITPVTSVTENRRYHGSAFLNDTSQILVYGGSQDGSDGLSTQTFLISTVSPYPVLSFESTAPPVTNPIVLPWNESSAVMVGGSETNTAVYTFTPSSAWQNEGVNLTSPITNQSSSSSALLTLDDGSKVLETFNMATNPNTVNFTILLNSGGTVASSGEQLGSSTSSASVSSATSSASTRKRELTLSNLSTYNSSLAPTTTRTGISLAQGSNGYIVISGGNSKDVLVMFDQDSNGWLNASQLLQATPSTVTVGGTNSATSSTASATSTAATQDSSSNQHGLSHHSLLILGAVLGALFGLIALCIATLMVIRYLKKKQQGLHKRRASEFPEDKKPKRTSTSFSFHEQDQSLQPLSRAGMPMGRSPVPSASAAFFKEIEDRAKYPPPSEPSNLTRSALEGKQAGGAAKSRPLILPTKSQETSKSMNSSGIAEASSGEVDPSLKQTSHRKTDEGWSKYFQGNNAINLADGQSTYSRSDYRGSGWPEASDFAPPRSPGEKESTTSGFQFRRGNVPFGSPSLEHPSTNSRGMGLAVSEGISPKISTAGSVSSVSSVVSEEEGHDESHDTVDYDRIGDAYSSGIPASIHDDQIWNAVGNGYRPGNRRSSSYYTQSYASGPRDTTLSSFPAPGTSRPRWTADSGDVHPGFPGPITNTQQGRGRGPEPTQDEVRDYFSSKPGNRSNTPSDVSWLNLGNNR